MRAVVIVGDYRTFPYAVKSMKKILTGADVYVSTWKTSSCVNNASPDFVYEFPPMDEERLRTILDGYHLVDFVLEQYDHSYWFRTGYNANLIHRWTVGAQMIRDSGKEYNSVLFIRPDMFFRDDTSIVDAMNNVQAGEFATIWSDDERVNERKTLNDTLFICKPAEMESCIPPLELFKEHRKDDWHTFYCWYVKEHCGMKIKNIHSNASMLRPPIDYDPTWEEVMKGAAAWDRVHIFNTLRYHGLRIAVRDWGKKEIRKAFKIEREHRKNRK